jgi:hypothetical protein
MYTAKDVRKTKQDELDRRIERAVNDRDAGPNAAYLRVYIEDSFCRTIEHELARRGFKNIRVPDITLKGDVYFEWDDE